MNDLPPGLSRIGIRGGRWLPAFACVVLGVTAGLLTVREPGRAIVANAMAALSSLLNPPVVSYQSNPSGGQVSVQVEATATKVTVSPDGSELWLEVFGATDHRVEDIAVEDGVVRSFGILPTGQSSFAVLVQLSAYAGHQLAQSEDVVTVNLPRSPLVGRKIVLDPGHGGRDPGCVSPSGLREAALNLSVAEELRRLLEGAGASVRLTRDDQTDFAQFSNHTMDSVERTAVATGWEADVLLSIHFNSFTSSRYHGTEVWHQSGSPESARLASMAMSELAQLGTARRGAKEGDYAVLRGASMPAALVELGFLSNPTDQAFFSNPSNCDQAAMLVWRALLNYFR